MHGFINILVAAALVWSGSPPENVLVELLEDRDPGHFAFSDEDLRWKDWTADLPAIEACRNELLVSFGSCSFDEPRADLRALGWL